LFSVRFQIGVRGATKVCQVLGEEIFLCVLPLKRFRMKFHA